MRSLCYNKLRRAQHTTQKEENVTRAEFESKCRNHFGKYISVVANGKTIEGGLLGIDCGDDEFGYEGYISIQPYTRRAAVWVEIDQIDLNQCKFQ